MTPDPVAEFAEAAGWASDLVATLPTNEWERPGLGAWDLRALVGHTSRSLVTVLTYLRTEATEIAVHSALTYIMGVARVDHSAVVDRGVQAGRDLGDDPAGRFTALAREAVDALAGQDLDRPVVTIAGGMRIRDYLPTRSFELVVHGLDIGRAVGLPVTPPRGPLTTALRLSADAALAGGSGAALLLALTGREPGLGFSVI